jgi:hypothetical protein
VVGCDMKALLSWGIAAEPPFHFIEEPGGIAPAGGGGHASAVDACARTRAFSCAAPPPSPVQPLPLSPPLPLPHPRCGGWRAGEDAIAALAGIGVAGDGAIGSGGSAVLSASDAGEGADVAVLPHHGLRRPLAAYGALPLAHLRLLAALVALLAARRDPDLPSQSFLQQHEASLLAALTPLLESTSVPATAAGLVTECADALLAHGVVTEPATSARLAGVVAAGLATGPRPVLLSALQRLVASVTAPTTTRATRVTAAAMVQALSRQAGHICWRLLAAAQGSAGDGAAAVAALRLLCTLALLPSAGAGAGAGAEAGARSDGGWVRSHNPWTAVLATLDGDASTRVRHAWSQALQAHPHHAALHSHASGQRPAKWTLWGLVWLQVVAARDHDLVGLAARCGHTWTLIKQQEAAAASGAAGRTWAVAPSHRSSAGATAAPTWCIAVVRSIAAAAMAPHQDTLLAVLERASDAGGALHDLAAWVVSTASSLAAGALVATSSVDLPSLPLPTLAMSAEGGASLHVDAGEVAAAARCVVAAVALPASKGVAPLAAAAAAFVAVAARARAIIAAAPHADWWTQWRRAAVVWLLVARASIGAVAAAPAGAGSGGAGVLDDAWSAACTDDGRGAQAVGAWLAASDGEATAVTPWSLSATGGEAEHRLGAAVARAWAGAAGRTRFASAYTSEWWAAVFAWLMAAPVEDGVAGEALRRLLQAAAVHCAHAPSPTGPSGLHAVSAWWGVTEATALAWVDATRPGRAEPFASRVRACGAIVGAITMHAIARAPWLVRASPAAAAAPVVDAANRAALAAVRLLAAGFAMARGGDGTAMTAVLPLLASLLQPLSAGGGDATDTRWLQPSTCTAAAQAILTLAQADAAQFRAWLAALAPEDKAVVETGLRKAASSAVEPVRLELLTEAAALAVVSAVSAPPGAAAQPVASASGPSSSGGGGGGGGTPAPAAAGVGKPGGLRLFDASKFKAAAAAAKPPAPAPPPTAGAEGGGSGSSLAAWLASGGAESEELGIRARAATDSDSDGGGEGEGGET